MDIMDDENDLECNTHLYHDNLELSFRNNEQFARYLKCKLGLTMARFFEDW